MKKVLKILISMILLVLMLAMQLNVVYADIDADQFDPRPGIQDSPGFNDRVNVIVGIIRAVGIIVSVIALIIIGIRTMTGSAEEKSVYKESLPGYLIGVILVLAMTTIPSIIYNFTKG